jgi:hypothetical protein
MADILVYSSSAYLAGSRDKLMRSQEAVGVYNRSSPLVAVMPKLSLNSLPWSKFIETFCQVVLAFGIQPQFV